tara:strand:+ start:4831 stop:5190 length:360 start_codon:yes stop_codon:yes gene_type:complete
MTIKISTTQGVSELAAAGPLQQPMAFPLSGRIETAARKVFASEDGAITSGFWRAEPGASRWEFIDRGEIIQVLSGRMSAEEDGRDVIHAEPGDVVVFPVGWKGVWTVTETLTKFYVIYR